MKDNKFNKVINALHLKTRQLRKERIYIFFVSSFMQAILELNASRIDLNNKELTSTIYTPTFFFKGIDVYASREVEEIIKEIVRGRK